MMTIYLTFDVDWAPDYMVDQVVNICLESGINATFFVTHPSETLTRLKQYPNQFEIGIHPNFLQKSTQGSTEIKILEYCKNIVPRAQSVRMHSLYQHTPLFLSLNSHLNSQIVDSSIFMPGVQNIQPFRLYTPSGCIIRVPFCWADDYYLLGKQRLEPEELIHSDGCKVYIFHPVHIFHNTISMDHYSAIKSNMELNRFKGRGISDVFIMFLKNVINRNIKTGLMRDFLKFNLEEKSEN